MDNRTKMGNFEINQPEFFYRSHKKNRKAKHSCTQYKSPLIPNSAPPNPKNRRYKSAGTNKKNGPQWVANESGGGLPAIHYQEKKWKNSASKVFLRCSRISTLSPEHYQLLVPFSRLPMRYHRSTTLGCGNLIGDEKNSPPLSVL
jgi:hypothetical protein